MYGLVEVLLGICERTGALQGVGLLEPWDAVQKATLQHQDDLRSPERWDTNLHKPGPQDPRQGLAIVVRAIVLGGEEREARGALHHLLRPWDQKLPLVLQEGQQAIEDPDVCQVQLVGQEPRPRLHGLGQRAHQEIEGHFPPRLLMGGRDPRAEVVLEGCRVGVVQPPEGLGLLAATRRPCRAVLRQEIHQPRLAGRCRALQEDRQAAQHANGHCLGELIPRGGLFGVEDVLSGPSRVARSVTRSRNGSCPSSTTGTSISRKKVFRACTRNSGVVRCSTTSSMAAVAHWRA